MENILKFPFRELKREDLVFIYIIATVKNGFHCAPVKIGIAKDPKRRLKELQGANPNELVLVYQSANADATEARNLEQFCHKVAKPKRLRGEWFDLHPAVAMDLLCRCGERDVWSGKNPVADIGKKYFLIQQKEAIDFWLDWCPNTDFKWAETA